LDELGEECEAPNKEAQVNDEKQKDPCTYNERDISIGVDSYNNPIDNSKKRKKSCEKSQLKTFEPIFPIDGIEERDKGKPGQTFKIKIGKRKDEKNGRSEAE
jgi:hypothetical protein